ncbi:MAG: PAS domain S-box protein [Anaerolineae bacterium]|nr:PAS domain S-box protein [Anaerolineae bacterium]
MKQNHFSLAIRLTSWLLIFSILPFMLMTFLVSKNIRQAVLNSTISHHLELNNFLAKQFSLSDDLSEERLIISEINEPQHTIFILDRQGNYLYRPEASINGSETEPELGEDVLHAVLTGKEGYTINDASIITYAPVEGKDQIVVIKTEKDGLNDFIVQLEYSVNWQTIVGTLLIGITASLIIWLMIGAPLRQLTKAAEEMGQGNLMAQVDPTRMKDELAVLADSFNQMGRRIQELISGFQLRVEELNLTQQALAESETRIQNILNAINDAIFVHDIDTGAILDVNRKSIEMYGYSRQEFSQISIADISAGASPYSQHEALLWLHKAASGEPQLFEWLGKDKWGRMFWVEMNMRLAVIANKNYIMASARDISERMEMEEALQEKTAELDRYFNNSLDLLCIVDFQGYFRRLNPEWERMLGYSLSEMLGKPFIDFVHPDDRADTDSILKTAVQKEVVNFENRYRDKNGEYHWIEWRSQPDGELIYAAAHEITERKKANQALKNYANRLEVMQSIHQGILAAISLQQISDVVAGHIHALIPCERFYFALIDMQNKKITPVKLVDQQSDQVEPRFDIDFDAHIADLVFIQDDVISVPDIEAMPFPTLFYQNMLKNGVHSSLRAYLRNGDVCVGVIGLTAQKAYAFDTEHLNIMRELAAILSVAIQQNEFKERDRRNTEELEARVRQRTSQLESANKELETFSYSVSHDLKSPLRVIEGFSKILVSEYAGALDDEGRSYLNRIAVNIKRMGQLIDDLLAYSRLERRAFSSDRVNLQHMLNSVIDERKDDLQNSRAKLSIELADGFVLADYEGLRQALRNLLDNALKFTRDVQAPEIEIKGVKRGNTYLLWVKDNGIGFDMQYHDRIFDMFNRLHRQEDYPGTGVGLALVYKAMARMGGRVWAESSPGQGATFYLEIPGL